MHDFFSTQSLAVDSALNGDYLGTVITPHDNQQEPFSLEESTFHYEDSTPLIDSFVATEFYEEPIESLELEPTFFEKNESIEEKTQPVEEPKRRKASLLRRILAYLLGLKI